jgi:hypothetical protein
MHLPTMSANPDFYDYVHRLVFHEGGSVDMLDGGGQAFIFAAHADCQIRGLTTTAAMVTFHNIVEVNPYNREQVVRTIDSFTVEVIREDGLFPFQCDVMWNVPDSDEWPCLLFTTRYIFAADPMHIGYINRQRRPIYYLPGSVNGMETERYYYPLEQSQRLPAKELFARGIPKDAFWKIEE